MAAQRERHLSAGGVYFKRVVHQVKQKLSQSIRIPVDQSLVFGTQANGDPLGHHLCLPVDSQQQGIHLYRLLLQGHACICLCQQQQIVDQPTHASGFVGDRTQRFGPRCRVVGSPALSEDPGCREWWSEACADRG